MKKICLIAILFLFTGMIFGFTQVKASESQIIIDGGITYERSIDYSQTETMKSCSRPELYAGEDLTGRYLGYTREFVLGGEFSSFESGDYYYQNVGSIHRIWEIYEICYIFNEDILSVDLNGDAFYNEEYSGVLWEYDFSHIADNPAFKDFAGSGHDGTFKHYLMTGDPTGSWEDYYYVYKSLFVKYNPDLYMEILLIFASYYIIAQDVRDNAKDIAEEYYWDAAEAALGGVTDQFEGVLNTVTGGKTFLGVGLKDAVEVIAGFVFDLARGDAEDEAFIDAFYEAVKTGVSTGYCNNFDVKFGKAGEDICKFLVKKTMGTADVNTDDIVVGDFVTDLSLGVTEGLIEYVAKKALGGITLVVAETAFHLFMGISYTCKAEVFDNLMGDIADIIGLFSDPDYSGGRNLRFDFIFNYNQGFSYDRNDTEAELNWWWNESMRYMQDGLVISFNESDVVNKVVGKDLMMVDFDELSNYCDIPQNATNEEIAELMMTYVFTDIQGNITLLTDIQVIDILHEYVHMVPSYDNTPVFEHYDRVDYRFFSYLATPEFEVEYTVDRNQHYDINTFANTPVLKATYISKTSYSASIYYDILSNESDFVSSEVRIFKNGVLKGTYPLNPSYSSKYISSLYSNTTYTYEIWTVFNSPYDQGTIQVMTDSGSFRTNVYIGPIKPGIPLLM